MKTLKISTRFALLFGFGVWIYFLFAVPTFDFDESLYRRVVEAMKANHNPWLLTWDGDPLYHKPPVFYWLVWFFSLIIDGANAGVSSLAARLPSFFSSVGILIGLYFGLSYVKGEKRSSFNWIPVLGFLMAAFPLFTGASVVFDPLQTFFLLPALLIPARFFYSGKPLRAKEWVFWSLSLFLASASKGLNGIIVPSLAFGLHLLFELRKTPFSSVFKTGLRYLFFAFIPAAILIAGFYYLLDQKIGHAFSHEFLWVQHFERSQNAMEQHSGSFLYHPLVIFLGGGFLTPLLFYVYRRNRKPFLEYGFPLTFVLAFILTFTFSATKLPHYTWPAWPALALYLGLILDDKTLEKQDAKIDRWAGILLSLPVLLLGTVLFLFTTTSQEWAEVMMEAAPKQTMAISLLNHLPPVSILSQICLYLGGFICLLFLARRRQITHFIELTTAFSTLCSLLLVVGLAPTAKGLLITPFQEIAESLKSLHPKKDECIRASGALSPTLSLAVGTELILNRCDANTMRYLITPEWKADECQANHLEKVDQKSYLVLCAKKTN